MRNALSDQTIKAMSPPEKGYRILWDGSLKGFGCRVSQAGTKAFVVLIESGRPKTIGRYPAVSLHSARGAAKRLLAEKTLGKLHPTRTAFADALRDFLAEVEKRNRPRTFRDYKRLLNRHFPFGRQALADLTSRDILKCLKGLDDTPSEKHHAFTAARALFKWCVQTHLIDRSPMEAMATPSNGQSRDRVLTEEELTAIYTIAIQGHSSFHKIVSLCLLTGQRRGEVARLEWEWVNEKDKTITLPAKLTKNGHIHTFPYGTLTEQVLNSIPKFEGNPYIFPAARDRKKGNPATTFNGFGKPKERFDLECGVSNWTLHDLRRTFSTGLAALGVDQTVTEKLLNHLSGGSQSEISRIYNRHSYLTEMRAAILRWEEHLNTLCAPKG